MSTAFYFLLGEVGFDADDEEGARGTTREFNFAIWELIILMIRFELNLTRFVEINRAFLSTDCVSLTSWAVNFDS